jgi:DNA-binding YbaB/EbfC family protein
MFKEMGQIANLMQQLPRIKDEMEKLQQRMGQLVAEGDAGAGMVKVKVNGRYEVLAVQLTDEALQGNDREMLEDLIKAATNQALAKVRQLVADETTKMATGLGMPPGMNLPGLTLCQMVGRIFNPPHGQLGGLKIRPTLQPPHLALETQSWSRYERATAGVKHGGKRTQRRHRPSDARTGQAPRNWT